MLETLVIIYLKSQFDCVPYHLICEIFCRLIHLFLANEAQEKVCFKDFWESFAFVKKSSHKTWSFLCLTPQGRSNENLIAISWGMSPPQDLNERHKTEEAFWKLLEAGSLASDALETCSNFFSSQEKQPLLSESTVNYYYFFNFMLNAKFQWSYIFEDYLFLFIYQNWFAYMIINTTTHSFSDLIVSNQLYVWEALIHYSTSSTSASYFPE